MQIDEEFIKGMPFPDKFIENLKDENADLRSSKQFDKSGY